MLKTTVSSQMLVARVLAANEVLVTKMLAADEVVGAEGGGKSIEKFVEPKTGKSSKSKKISSAKENDLEMLDTKLTMQSSWPGTGFQDLVAQFRKLQA